MNDDLVQGLLSAETDFLDALQNGPQMLASYCEALSALRNALSTARKTGGAGNETLSLAHCVASRILNLANCFLDIKREEELSTSRLQSDYDAIFHQMDALDLNAQPKSFSPADLRTSTLNVESTSSILTSAYQWFLDNLHNPYPTAEVKARIAAASSCQVSSINSWFINARRRIGWTTLRRERFANCKADMIDAAYRALVEEDPQRALAPELRHSFVTMKVAAEGLYSSTSTFAGDLDAIVKDMTEEDAESVRIEKYGQGDKANLTKAAQNPYSSPDPSITASPVPGLCDSLTDDSEKEEDVTPPIIAGSKRRRSSIEPVDQTSSTASRPIKRLRVSMTSQMCLPSPPSSTNGIDESPDHSSPDLSPPHFVPPEMNEVLPYRKRRLSDADATGIPKRPSDSIVAPRHHTTSDPLPRSNTESEYSIDDWFKTNFDDLFAIPPPIDATMPDFSVPWEVELFKDYSIPGDPKYAPKYSPAPDTHILPPTDLSLDNLLRTIGGDTFTTPLDGVLLSNVTGVPCTSYRASSISDISQTNIDRTSLLNGTEAYEPTVYSTFPQYPTDSQPLTEIDLSMLQLPPLMPVVNPQGNFASKQAKLHHLHAMQEAVWRMEQELRSEGVVI